MGERVEKEVPVYHRRCEEHAVEAVEDTPVPEEHPGGILDMHVTLYDGFREVAGLTRQTREDRHYHRVRKGVSRKGARSRSESDRAEKPSDEPFTGLSR